MKTPQWTLKKKTGLLDGSINKYFLSFATELIRSKNAEHHVISSDDDQYALPRSLPHSFDIPKVCCYLTAIPNNFNSSFTKTPIINQFLSD